MPVAAKPLPPGPEQRDFGLARLRVEIEERLGGVPALYELAFSDPHALKELWRQTRLDWLESPIPPDFRYALLDALAERHPWPWGPVAEAAREIPVEAELSTGRDAEAWPEPRSREQRELVALTLRLILDGPDEVVRTRLVAILGDRRYASLVRMLTFLETCRMFAQAHPGLAASAPDPDHSAVEAPRAQLAFEGAPTGMALVKIEPGARWVITEVNRAMGVLTSRDASELVGLSISEITDPADAGADADVLGKLLAGEIPAYEVTKRFLRADGERFWGEMSVSLIRDEEEHAPIYLVVQLADISERRRVEDALNVSHDRFASVFEEAPTGMGLVSLDNRWVQVNEALCQTLGYGEDELLRKRLHDVIAPDDVETIGRYLRQVLAGEVLGYHVETRVIRATGELVWVQLSVALVHDYDASPAYVFVEVQDISERKRLEEELEQGALLDAVTGLPSRALLFDRLEQARARLERSGSPFAVLFVEAEGLEAASGELGRDRADAVLKEVGARLLAAVHPGDTVARYSGSEFVVLCEDLDSDEEATIIARRILELARFAIGEEGSAIQISPTVGLTVAAAREDSPAALVERADAAMQDAKSQGIDCQEYCGSL